jgi:hypothetical protein
MDIDKYSLIFDGTLIDGFDITKTVAELRKLGLTNDGIRKLIDAKGKSILNNVTPEKAKKTYNALTKCGLHCRIIRFDEYETIKNTADEKTITSTAPVQNEVKEQYIDSEINRCQNNKKYNILQKLCKSIFKLVCGMFSSANILVKLTAILGSIALTLGPSYFIYTSLFGSGGILNKEVRTTITAQLLATREIGMLYTGLYFVPVIDAEYDILKRDIFSSNPKKVIKGYCKREYEVGYGYNNLDKLLSDDKILNEACSHDTSSLPNPEILSVEPKATERKGDYPGDGACFQLDRNEDVRNEIIEEILEDTGALQSIRENGKMSLRAIASTLCQ